MSQPCAVTWLQSPAQQPPDHHDTFFGVGGLVVFCDPPAEKLGLQLLARNLEEDGLTFGALTTRAAGFAGVLQERPVVRYEARNAKDLRAVLATVRQRLNIV